MAQINKPTDYFNTIFYTGNNTADHQITGVGFRPEFFWTKSRNIAQDNLLFDFVRGTEKFLKANTTTAEDTQSGTVTSFDSDGVTFGASSAGNASGYNYVAWNWLAGGTASSNTDGNLTSQVSANTTSGFSIVSWTTDGTNNTVGHGLGQTPSIVIAKNRSNTSNFDIITNVIDGSLDYLKLNLTDAKSDLTGYTLNSSVFSLTYTSGSNAIAYCFAEKKGFSKFGSYTGNGSSDGTFVYTGFKPAFVMIKRTDASASWELSDNKRTPDNPVDIRLRPDTTSADLTASDVFDFLSNGFKVRTSGTDFNASGGTYIYMAFASSPLVGTNNIPATAR